MSVRNKDLGFNLIEVMVALLVVGILAAIAVPSYLRYMSRSAYSEITATADRYKASVAACLDYTSGVATNCNGGSNSIPANITAPGVGMVYSATVAAGTITIIPNAQNGVTAAMTYVAVPTYSTNGVTWTISGGICGTGIITEC